jgi:hypothetical protein
VICSWTRMIPKSPAAAHSASSTIPRSSSRARSRQIARAPRPGPTAQPRTSRSGIGCGSARPCPRPERRSADRLSACGRARRSCGTCPVARREDGGRRVAARCRFYFRTTHRQLAQQGQHRARRSSCAADARRRWTGWRRPHSRRVALSVRTFPFQKDFP